MVKQANPAVVVAGASPAGLIAALCLVRDGVSVQLIDQDGNGPGAGETAPSDAADLAVLDPSSLAVLAQVDLLTQVLDAAERVEAVGVVAGGEQLAELSFAELAVTCGTQFPFLAVLSRARLRELVRQALQWGGVDVLPRRRLALIEQGAARVRVTIEQLGKDSVGYAVAHSELVVEKAEELEASYLLVTDGQGSVARAQLHLRTAEARPAEDCVEIEGRAQRPARAALILGEHTSGALWPLPGHRYSGLLAGRDPDSLTSEGAGWSGVIGSDAGPARVQSRFQARYCSVDHFGVGRVWLAGGAAHSTSPLASNDLNAGLWEARQLAHILARALRGHDPADALVDYDRTCARDGQRRLGLAPLRARWGAAPALLRHADRLLPCVPARAGELDALLGQLRLSWA